MHGSLDRSNTFNNMTAARFPGRRVTSLDAFQLPGLVADAVKAADDLWVGIELQLVLNLLRIDRAIAQRAQLTVTRSSPQILLRFAR